MDKFSERFNELMGDTDVHTLMVYMGFAGPTIIYDWKNSKKGMLTDTAIKLADYFHCSLDYLFGRTDEDRQFDNIRECPSFDIQLRKVLSEQKISQYKLLQDKIVSRGNLNNWFNRKCTPHIESIIKLANYLRVTMDYLVGRE